MKNNLIENDKIKTSLINQLKLNRKSIEILKPLNLIKKSDYSIQSQQEKIIQKRKPSIKNIILILNYLPRIINLV